MRKVRTPEGSRFYGLPLGSPITADAVARAKQRQKAGTPKPDPKPAPPGGSKGGSARAATPKATPKTTPKATPKAAPKAAPEAAPQKRGFLGRKRTLASPTGNADISYEVGEDETVVVTTPQGQITLDESLQDAVLEKIAQGASKSSSSTQSDASSKVPEGFPTAADHSYDDGPVRPQEVASEFHGDVTWFTPKGYFKYDTKDKTLTSGFSSGKGPAREKQGTFDSVEDVREAMSAAGFVMDGRVPVAEYDSESRVMWQNGYAVHTWDKQSKELTFSSSGEGRGEPQGKFETVQDVRKHLAENENLAIDDMDADVSEVPAPAGPIKSTPPPASDYLKKRGGRVNTLPGAENTSPNGDTTWDFGLDGFSWKADTKRLRGGYDYDGATDLGTHETAEDARDYLREIGYNVGNYKNAEQAADYISRRAVEVEPALTESLKGLAAEKGMTMEGLDFRLKARDSLLRKITVDQRYTGDSFDEVAATIRDAVRYTMADKPESLVENMRAVLEDFKERDFEMRVKNTWKPGSPYKGVNVIMTDPDGYQFELQFHTADSLAVKEVNHKLYEAERVLDMDDPQKVVLADKMRQNASEIPDPPGIADFDFS